MTEKEQFQSDLINASRLPLIYLVIMIHTHYNDTIVSMDAGFGNYFYYLFTEVITRNFLLSVVPCFFIFSSYYFFYKLKGLPELFTEAIPWSESFYYNELSKRIKGLLIPFLLWGIIFIIGYWSKNYIFGLIGLGQDEAQMKELQRSLGSMIWESIDAPLWYIRDLMCMMLLSPLFYYWVKYTKLIGILLLYAYYVSGINIPVPGLSSTAIFFFGIGAYLSLNKKYIGDVFWSMRYIALIVTLTFPLVAIIFFDKTTTSDILVRLYCPMGSITIVNMINVLIRRSAGIKAFFIKYSPMVFFVYAVNELYILNWVKGAYARLPYSDTLFIKLCSFILIPLTTVWLCILLFKFMMRYSPRILVVLSGGRIS